LNLLFPSLRMLLPWPLTQLFLQSFRSQLTSQSSPRTLDLASMERSWSSLVTCSLFLFPSYSLTSSEIFFLVCVLSFYWNITTWSQASVLQSTCDVLNILANLTQSRHS
jgi:hypothetical protein